MNRKFIIFFTLFFLGMCLNAKQTFSHDIPKFKVIGQFNTALSLLVPSSTTKGQLIKLVYAFKEARKKNMLSELIPPTTPMGTKGPYALIQIYIFDDSKWATKEDLKNFLDPNIPLVSSGSYKNKRKKFVK